MAEQGGEKAAGVRGTGIYDVWEVGEKRKLEDICVQIIFLDVNEGA